MAYLSSRKDGSALLKVFVQPKASRNHICGLYDGCLKIAVTAPPVDGKATAAVAAFLADSIGVAKRNVQLKSGQTSRRKVFHVTGTAIEDIRGHIESILKAEREA